MRVNVNGRDTDLAGLARFAGSLIVECRRCGRPVSKYDRGWKREEHERCPANEPFPAPED